MKETKTEVACQRSRQLLRLLPCVTGLVVSVLVLVLTWSAAHRQLSLDDRAHLATYAVRNQTLGGLEVIKLRHWQDQSLDAVWRPICKLLWWAMQRNGIMVPPALTILTALLAGLCAGAFCRILQAGRRPKALMPVLAALPLLHPLSADVLLPYVGQIDLMAALGVVGAAALLGTGRRVHLILACVLIAFAFVSKESAWPAMVALPSFCLFGGGSCRYRRRITSRVLGVSIAILLGLLVVRQGLFGRAAYTTGGAGAVLAPGERRVGTLEIVGRYAMAFVMPRIPQTDYSFLKQPGSSGGAYPALGAVALVGIVAAFIALLRRTPASRHNARRLRARRRMASAILWIVLFLLPYVGVVPIGALWAGRFAFLSLFGFAMLILEMAESVPLRFRWMPALYVVALLLVGGVGLVLRAGDWSSPLCLWQAEVRREPSHAFAWKNLAAHLQAAGDTEGAYDAICHATTLWPTFGEAWLARGQIARARNLPDDAEQSFLRAEALMPEDSTVQLEIAKLLAYRRRFPQAAERLDRLLQRDPDNVEVRRVLDHVLSEPEMKR